MAAMNPSSPQPTARSAPVVSAFMTEYSANFEFYKETSEFAKEICEAALRTHAIPIEGRVTYRAKDPASLEEKIHKRQASHEYQTKEDIKADIGDMCGVRIRMDSALAKDRAIVRDIIHDKFYVIRQKDHPDPSEPSRFSSSRQPQREGVYQKRFPPYFATHYYVNLKGQDAIQRDLGDAKGSIIEIQVRSFIHDQNAIQEHSNYKSGSEPNPKLASSFDVMSGMGKIMEVLEEKRQMEIMEIAKQEAKDDRVFETWNDLGLFIDEWVDKEAEAWVNKKWPEKESCKAFLYLLQLENFKSMNCQREVRKHLQNSLSEQSVCDRICSLYGFASLKRIGLLVDRILLTDDGKPTVPLPTFDGLDKIQVIMNTIRWLDKLFEPSLTWTWPFDTSPERRMLFYGLDWLVCTGRLRLQNKEQLNAVDTMHLQALWSWFEAQDARQIQLTFTMSRCGIKREEEEINVIERLIYGLGWLS